MHGCTLSCVHVAAVAPATAADTAAVAPSAAPPTPRPARTPAPGSHEAMKLLELSITKLPVEFAARYSWLGLDFDHFPRIHRRYMHGCSHGCLHGAHADWVVRSNAVPDARRFRCNDFDINLTHLSSW